MKKETKEKVVKELNKDDRGVEKQWNRGNSNRVRRRLKDKHIEKN